MNGQDLYNAVTTLLQGFSIDKTQFYQFLNTARTNREMMRPWKRLEKLDQSQTATTTSLPTLVNQNPKTLPEDFMFLKEDGYLTLYDNNNQWEDYYEVPQDQAIRFLQENNRFYIDHANGVYYLTGIVNKPYNIFMYYQYDSGDITEDTKWNLVPTNKQGTFPMILAYDVASMWRLGVDYDDINARNADSNARQAELLFNSMSKWDDNLARSAVTQLDYSNQGGNFNHRININDD